MPASAPQPPSAPPTTLRWSAESGSVVDRRDGIAATLDPRDPAAGLSVAVATSAARSPVAVDHLLGLDLGTTCRPADHWLRGGDFTVVYEPADARHLRATAMWRLRAATVGVTAWELIVSAQTSLLHSRPALAVVADVAGEELLAGGRLAATAGSDGARSWSSPAGYGSLPDDTACALVRRGAAEELAALSVLVAVHPLDPHRIAVRRHGGRVRLECRLFPEALEKGVLLRSRVLAAIGPSAGDRAWADRLVAAFEASPPPLTT